MSNIFIEKKYYLDGKTLVEREKNQDGITIKTTYYYRDGITIQTILKHNPLNGKVIKSIDYYSNGSIWTIGEYDDNEIITKFIHYSIDGSHCYIAKFDIKGFATKLTYYNNDNTIEYIDEFHPNSNQLRKKTTYLCHDLHNVKEYDIDGKLIKEMNYHIIDTRKRT